MDEIAEVEEVVNKRTQAEDGEAAKRDATPKALTSRMMTYSEALFLRLRGPQG